MPDRWKPSVKQRDINQRSSGVHGWSDKSQGIRQQSSHGKIKVYGGEVHVMGAGRPTIYSQELAERICARISEGEPLKSLCAGAGMPSRETVYAWVRSNKEFSDMYARAKELQLDRMAEDLLEISDDGTNDWMERATRSGDVETVVNNEHINRSRLRVDTRKWLLSKLMPKKYGEKTALELTGKDGGPVQYETMTDEQLESRLADLLRKAGIDANS